MTTHGEATAVVGHCRRDCPMFDSADPNHIFHQPGAIFIPEQVNCQICRYGHQVWLESYQDGWASVFSNSNEARNFAVEWCSEGGICHFCLNLYGKDKLAAGAGIFKVTRQDDVLALGSCGYHLETTMTMWDAINSELTRK